AVRAPLPGAVQEENQRPGGFRGIVRRDVDLIAVTLARHGDRAVEESRLHALSLDRSGKEKKECGTSELPFGIHILSTSARNRGCPRNESRSGSFSSHSLCPKPFWIAFSRIAIASSVSSCWAYAHATL